MGLKGSEKHFRALVAFCDLGRMKTLLGNPGLGFFLVVNDPHQVLKVSLCDVVSWVVFKLLTWNE